MTQWHIFSGERKPATVTLPPAPPWRTFVEPAADQLYDCGSVEDDDRYWDHARAYQTPPAIIDAINAALILRRPLLVTGPPGTGKSSLIYRIAYELKLGPVLVWPVNSRTTLENGLYDYDAIGRLRDQSLSGGSAPDIGKYIRLQALGTALLPSKRPRALLIDELDKADPDLPNALLNALEEGWFEIPELQRDECEEVEVRVASSAKVMTAQVEKARIRGGRVQCHEFPFIVFTSNDEREFPAAFLRRCIRIELQAPDDKALTKIVEAQMGSEAAAKVQKYISEFAENDTVSATDQLLNAAYLIHKVNQGTPDEAQKFYDLLTRPLS